MQLFHLPEFGSCVMHLQLEDRLHKAVPRSSFVFASGGATTTAFNWARLGSLILFSPYVLRNLLLRNRRGLLIETSSLQFMCTLRSFLALRCHFKLIFWCACYEYPLVSFVCWCSASQVLFYASFETHPIGADCSSVYVVLLRFRYVRAWDVPLFLHYTVHKYNLVNDYLQLLYLQK